MNLETIAQRAKDIFCLCLATFVVCAGVLLNWGSPAIAANSVEQAVDNVVGAGTTNQVQGQIEESLGGAKRQLDKTTGQADGVAKQVTGRAQKDIGRTQQAAEETAESIEDSAEGFVDSVKDFFQ